MSRRARRWRLQDRFLALVVGLVLALQLLVFVAVDVSVNRAVAESLGHELDVGERFWARFINAREEQLADSAGLLAADFGFRGAVASLDIPTMRSALDNHALRLGATLTALHGPAGEWLTGSANADPGRLAHGVAAAQADGRASGLVMLPGGVFQLATVPVMAPDLVGWVSLGLPVDVALLNEFRALSSLDVAIRADGAYPVSTLPGLARSGTDLADLSGQGMVSLPEGDYQLSVQPIPASGPSPAAVLLLASRQDALAPYQRLKLWVVGLSALGALLALAVAALVGRGVSRPVSQLAGAARRVADGDFSMRVPPSRNDEVGDLADAFNRMQEHLQVRESRILHQARHDGLTGLPNRAHATHMLEAAIEQAASAGGACAVLMVDLDRFKEVNDTLGHAFGDDLLLEVAKRLGSAVRKVDTVGRMGGDEFVAILPGLQREAAMASALDLARRLREPIRLSGTQVAIESSIGVALFPEHGERAEPLLRRADMAMYEAKDRHLPACLYQPGREESHLRQLGLMSDLRQAEARGQLRLVFQPKLQLPEGEARHAEALLRWNHPGLGPISPEEFIPLAERAGIIHDLSHFVIDGALSACRAWADAGLDLGVSINLSVIDLLDDALPDTIVEALSRHGVAPGRLIVEVTESAVMRDIDYAVRVLERLRDAGVKLSIDDFGTGHSSLSQLKRLPVHELKIDKSFVMRLVAGSDDDIIVRSTIEIGHNMGLSVIAEGVETEAGLSLLKRYGCDMAQGFLFSPPLEAADFVGWCRRNARPDPVG